MAIAPDDDAHGATGCSVSSALTNLKLFTWIIKTHPLRHRIAGLEVYLEAVNSFLKQQMASMPGQSRRELMLGARMDDGEEPGDEVFDELVELSETLVNIMANARHWELDEVLGFSAGRMGFTQWRPWPRRFGLDTLAHPYFSRLHISMYDESEPQMPTPVKFEEFGRDPDTKPWAGLGSVFSWLFQGADQANKPEDGDTGDEAGHKQEQEQDQERGEEESDPWSGSGFRPVRVGARLGLRFVQEEAVCVHLGTEPSDYVDAAPDQLALAAEYDKLLPASNSHAWAGRNGQWALVALARQCHLLTDFCVDAVVQEADSWGTHVVKDGLCGLLCLETGRWLAAPTFDEMVWTDDGVGLLWRVRTGQRWGLLSTEGLLLHACVFDALPTYKTISYHNAPGLHVLLHGRAGWIDDKGVLEVACEWDEVTPSAATGYFVVKRAGLVGLVARGDQICLPCTYLDVEPLVLGAHVGIVELEWSTIGPYGWPYDADMVELAQAGAPDQANLLIAVRTQDAMGVVDQANRIVVPIRYSEVAAVDNGEYRDPRWMHLSAADGRRGLWSIALGAEVFSCEHQCLDVYAAPRIQDPLVGISDGQHYRLVHASGAPAYSESFTSISADEYDDARIVVDGVGNWDRAKIAEAWSEGRAVRATLRGVPAQTMALLPGEPLVPLEDTLARQYWELGDDEAALKLAKDFRLNGDGQQARLWAARACGHAGRPRAAPTGANDEDATGDDYYERRQARERFGKRAHYFAELLDQGVGGPRDAALARAFAHKAVEAQPHGTDPALLLLFGKLALDPAAGPIELQAGTDALLEIHHPNLEVGIAALLLARCVLSQPDPDLDNARGWLVMADAGGAADAAPELVAVLERMAMLANRADAKLLRREARYYRDKSEAAAATQSRQTE